MKVSKTKLVIIKIWRIYQNENKFFRQSNYFKLYDNIGYLFTRTGNKKQIEIIGDNKSSSSYQDHNQTHLSQGGIGAKSYRGL